MKLFSADNFRSPAALSRFLLTAAIGLSLDLWTKALAVKNLKYTGDEIRFIPGWLHFKYTENFGAVFGTGQGLRSLFIVVSFLAIAFLFWLFSTSGRQRFYQFILGLLMAGVIGNLYDRSVYGYVRDMIFALPQWPHLFPWIFNIADSLLCIGVGLMVIYSFVHPHPKTPSSAKASDK